MDLTHGLSLVRSWKRAGPKVTDEALHNHAQKVIYHHPVSSSQVSNNQGYSGGD